MNITSTPAPLKKLLTRKKESHKNLVELVKQKIPEMQGSKYYAVIGFNIGTTSQTIINYINGKTKDGYLLDAIIEELSKLPDLSEQK